ncbi:hypothetical protein [Caballeronia zhejiangensis]|uniref:hypothetical protein n=1 Tax=Caballeronia zhejiangensis TaxID=871203 RepID=UPI00158EF551|nr:hypothetical protein [Caballeronia zhejiangensis]
MFNLEGFEFSVYNRKHEEAAKELLGLLVQLDQHYGAFSDQFTAIGLPGFDGEEQQLYVVDRIAAALGTLISDADFSFSELGFRQLILFHRWVYSIFGSSSFRNADHVLRTLNQRGAGVAEIELKAKDIEKFCLLYTPESEIPLDIGALWKHDKRLAAALCIALITPRFLGSPAAHGKREIILKWLPNVIAEVVDIEDLPLGVLHDAYMHCSYADLPGRHDLKKGLNVLMRRKLDQHGLADINTKPETGAFDKAKRTEKPLMLIALEWFSGGHSIFRTHSETMRAARKHFRTVAIGYAHCVDAVGREVFDEFIEYTTPGDLVACLRQVRDCAVRFKPAVLYMPSVGMFPLTMFLSNLRVAPLQVAALGHPATTHSDKIDYISVEEDYVGDAACFSEKLLMLPRNGQPYVPSRNLPIIERAPGTFREEVHVAVPATAMKLNPGFLAACVAISQRSEVPIRFFFLTGLAHGIMLTHIRSFVEKRVLPNAEVVGHQSYGEYMNRLNACDMFLSPFPFGNTNGLVDALTVGLPGVCKRGPEVFESIDSAIFNRVGLPDWAIADTTDKYIDAAIRMIEDRDERNALRDRILKEELVRRLFEGEADSLGDNLLRLIEANSKTVME